MAISYQLSLGQKSLCAKGPEWGLVENAERVLVVTAYRVGPYETNPRLALCAP